MGRKKVECKDRKVGICGEENCVVCLPKSFAGCWKASMWSIKNELQPFQVALSCSKYFLFDCRDCGHEFSSSASNMSKISENTGCPFCNRKKICKKEENCQKCQDVSFSKHPKSLFWSKENPKPPEEFYNSSNKKALFDCDVCGHMFLQVINKVSREKNPNWCGYCGKRQLCPNDKECLWCFEHSFASHERAKFWSEKNLPITPRDVKCGTHDYYWFKCGDCNHDFEARMDHVTDKKEPSWCNFCGGNELCKDENCLWCFEHSFASHEKAKFWSKINTIAARQVRRCSLEKYLFECGDCKKDFSVRLNLATKGSWCPKCRYKTEKKVLKFLEEHFSSVFYQLRVNWCRSEKTGKFLPFDFCIGKTIIELDGPQHFRQVSNWQPPEITQASDRYKEEKAKENGYRVVRLVQEDIWKDSFDWKGFLMKELECEI